MKVRLRMWCPVAYPGYFPAATADGLFADQGVEAEIVDSAGGSKNIPAVAPGGR